MRSPKYRTLQASRDSMLVLEGAASVPDSESLATVVASTFVRLRLPQRVHVLRRLLLPVGPMALAVVGGGVFARYAIQARWPRMPVSVENAARITSSQIYELVRYVEQSNPVVLQQVLSVIARDATTMAALGASVAAIVMHHLASREAAPTAELSRKPK